MYFIPYGSFKLVKIRIPTYVFFAVGVYTTFGYHNPNEYTYVRNRHEKNPHVPDMISSLYL